MSFITKTRLFGKPVRANMLGGYIFDALLLLFIWMAYLGFNDLRAFGQGSSIVSVPAGDFVFFGGLGIYGIRIAMYIAMLRRNRMPQTLEWLAFLIPLAIAIPCFLASGRLVKLYATSHAYKYCYQQRRRSTVYTFASHASDCPTPPALPPSSP